jgi:ribonucleoside-diphosphate reductase alpha chain
MSTFHSYEQRADSDTALSDAALPQRRHLPDIRQSVTHKFTIDGQDGYIIVGLFEDGRPGEVFLKMAKQGSTVSGLMDTVGILTSLCLQFGVPIEALARKFEYMRFEPAGWTKCDEFRRAHSVVDYIFRWIGLRFSPTYRSQYRTDLGSENGP